jgi:glycosyltransferase involved in cell wall biosynthesis
MNHYFNIPVHSIYENDRRALKKVLGYPDQRIALDRARQSSKILFVKTHELPPDDAPAIYLVRDGRDALISYVHYTFRSYKAHEGNISFHDKYQLLRDLIINPDYFSGWSNHCAAWTNRKGTSSIIRFESLIAAENHQKLIIKVLNKLNIFPEYNKSAKNPPSFDSLKAVRPDLFRKGTSGNWVTEFPEDLHRLFWDKHGDVMHKLGYPRYYSSITKPTLKGGDVEADAEDPLITDLRSHIQQLYGEINALTLENQKKESVIESMQGGIEPLRSNIESLQDESTKLRLDLEEKELHLEEKEKVIQSLALINRNPLKYLVRKSIKAILPSFIVDHIINLKNFFHGPHMIDQRYQYTPPFIADHITNLKNFFYGPPKIEQFHQYTPRPIEVPSQYRNHRISLRNALPTVSIVTPSYNHGRFIEKTIHSVVGQDYPKLEYFVQDGGSADDTVKILNCNRSKLTGFESRPDGGQAQAINEGFKKTSGDLMAWLNSDDLLLPGAIWHVVQFFDRHPEIDVVYGHRINIDVDGLEIGRRIMPPHDNKIVMIVDYVPQETMFWRRGIWEKAGGYVDETYQFAMDWELLLRFMQNGAAIKRLQRFLGAFRVYNDQKTQSMVSVANNEVRKLRKFYIGNKLSDGQIRHKIKWFQIYSNFYYYFHHKTSRFSGKLQ